MNIYDVMSELQKLGTPQNIRIYRNHGAQGELFGVSLAHLKTLKKKITSEHPLAMELWETGNWDARRLALMIGDPRQTSYNELERLISHINDYVLADLLVSELLSRTPHVQRALQEWTKSDDEWRGRAGWTMLALFALSPTEIPNDWFIPRLEEIERHIHNAKNRAKEAMLNALIAIGSRNDALEPLALAAAERIGNIIILHGQTACKTPNPSEYIKKIKTHHNKKKK